MLDISTRQGKAGVVSGWRWVGLTQYTIYAASHVHALAFRRRTNQEQRQLGDDYRQLNLPTARKNFVKKHATRYTELSQLPYFNLVEQIVIDPMHNLFLGKF